MTAARTYLDYNASAPLLPEARSAMIDALDAANPSSVHGEGRAARRIIDQARRDVAALVGARPEHVVFTSGASEAASMLLTPDWRMGRSPVRMRRLFVAASDHPCTLSGGRFPADAVTVIGVDGDGIIDLAALEAGLVAHERSEGLALIAMHAANNETGVVQPVAELARIAKAHGAVLVVDAVQAAGRLHVDISDGYGDFLILSAHKLGGPKGVGAVVGVADLMMPAPLVSGGGQEKGHRAGTENVAGIAGFGAAARVALDGLAGSEATRSIRDAFEASVRELAPDAIIYGAAVERLCNTLLFSIPGLKAETAQIGLDLAGIAVSSGSACSSGKVATSHVLKAMGVDEGIGAIRVSIGAATTMENAAAFRSALAAHLARRSVRAA